jgi:uncharacterized protein (TIGR03086 family)
LDLRPLHRRALDTASSVIAEVSAGDLARPTPCTGWDLRALLAHMIGQNHGFAAAVEGLDAPRAAFAARPPDPPSATWATSAERVGTAFATAPPQREVLLVEISATRRFPVGVVVGFHLLDTVVHAWDVATALGRTFRPDDELVDATLAQARLIPAGPTARERPGAAFGPTRPSEEDPWKQTLALVGRTPNTHFGAILRPETRS